jgi:hypothetical protein
VRLFGDPKGQNYRRRLLNAVVMPIAQSLSVPELNGASLILARLSLSLSCFFLCLCFFFFSFFRFFDYERVQQTRKEKKIDVKVASKI